MAFFGGYVKLLNNVCLANGLERLRILHSHSSSIQNECETLKIVDGIQQVSENNKNSRSSIGLFDVEEFVV